MSAHLVPFKEIPHKVTSTVMAMHGCDFVIIVGVNMSDVGGMTISHAGIDARAGMIAESITEQIKTQCLEWERSDEAIALDKSIAEAKREMATGPENDPDAGKRLVLPSIKKVEEIGGARRKRDIAEKAAIANKKKPKATL